MEGDLDGFEELARRASLFTEVPDEQRRPSHPFEARGIHDGVAKVARKLFDDGNYSQATFEACKFLDHEVRRHAKASETGSRLMMQVFGGDDPKLKINLLSSQSERDEQDGYKFLFAGAMLAIRNPRGHEYSVVDSPDECLDHLAFASMLLRRLAEAGYH